MKFYTYMSPMFARVLNFTSVKQLLKNFVLYSENFLVMFSSIVNFHTDVTLFISFAYIRDMIFNKSKIVFIADSLSGVIIATVQSSRQFPNYVLIFYRMFFPLIFAV